MMPLFSGPITGRKAFALFSSFFIVIIAVNLVLAWQAIATFPGIEVRNSYVASQSFDADRDAQQALGWTAQARVQGDILTLSLTDANGAPVQAATVEATFGRATVARDDQTPRLQFDGIAYAAPVITAPGNWILRLRATATDGTLFQQRLSVVVEP
jgi:nitrogen fixation protein FixH